MGNMQRPFCYHRFGVTILNLQTIGELYSPKQDTCSKVSWKTLAIVFKKTKKKLLKLSQNIFESDILWVF